MAVALQGDAVSQLLQVQASMAGLKRMWVGKGAEDAHSVMIALANAQARANALWTGIQTMFAMPEMQEIPEAVRAQLCAIVLTANANFELGKKT